MASHSLAKATDALRRLNQARIANAQKNKQEGVLIETAAGSVGGSAVAGLLDAKMGKAGAPHKLGKTVPTNIAMGLAIALPAIAIRKFPLRGPAAAFGLAQAGAGLYRYIIDNVKPSAPAAAAA